MATVAVHHLDLPDRDFFFEPKDTKLSIYAGLANNGFTSVLVKNDTEQAMRIHRNMRLGVLHESDFDGYFPITSGQEDIAELATRRPREEHHNTWIHTVWKKLADSPASAMFTSTACEPADEDMPYIPANSNGQPAVEISPSTEDTVLPNGVTTYGDVPDLAAVANEFPDLWTEGGFAEVPLNE